MRALFLVVAAIALCIGAPAFAQLTQVDTGGFNNVGFGGTDPGFVYSNTGTTSILQNNFGGVFDGPATLTSFFIEQYPQVTRVRPKTLEFYNGTSTVQKVLADDQNLQEVTFDSPFSAPLGWVGVRVVDRYTAGSSDTNFGLMSYGFNGSVASTGTNLNFGLSPSITGGLGGGYTRPTELTNNVLYSNSMTDTVGSYFAKDAGVDAILVTYSEPKSVGSIGLGFETGDFGTERVTPKFVTLVGLDNADQQIVSQQISLFENLQFARYSVSGFNGVRKLRLDFPNGSNNSDWYLRSDNGAYGVSEFQAIAVPEPTTLTMVAVAGGCAFMGFSRRRRR